MDRIHVAFGREFDFALVVEKKKFFMVSNVRHPSSGWRMNTNNIHEHDHMNMNATFSRPDPLLCLIRRYGSSLLGGCYA